mmetsp:Transcript_20000/g.31775  ORF Transcript_20000/g.31775 Transcript_20000/m.31775 type:complete len:88 (-) Transcript_20000:678-941(-)
MHRPSERVNECHTNEEVLKVRLRTIVRSTARPNGKTTKESEEHHLSVVARATSLSDFPRQKSSAGPFQSVARHWQSTKRSASLKTTS